MQLNDRRPVVDWSLYDQAPQHWGAAMTVATVTSAMRNCEYGDRESWVDLLSELLEGDPNTHAVLKKCYSAISSKGWALVPKRFDDSEAENENARIVAEDVTARIAAVPNWSSRVYQLCWGHFSGAAAHEIMWAANDGWSILELRCVPSRRLQYDQHFDLYATDGNYATSGLYLNSLPGKFITFEPCVTGDVPTREGVGRVVAYWMAFKRWASRDLLSYIERFGKPMPVCTYKTGRETADEDDVALAQSIVQDIGRGTQPGAYLPDTLTLTFPSSQSAGGSGGADKTIHSAFIDKCNNEITIGVLGNTLTTSVGSSGGNRALGQVHENEEQYLIESIASQVDECITRYIVFWLVKLNFGDDALKYLPQYRTAIEPEIDMKPAADVLRILVESGLQVAAADVYERFGWRRPNNGEPVLGDIGLIGDSGNMRSEDEQENDK